MADSVTETPIAPSVAPASAPITSESLGALNGDSFRALLPEEVRSKPYAKDINTFGDFVKKFDGAQTLLGQRTLPDANSTPDQWKEFHGKLAPKSADDYKLPAAIDGLPADFVKNAAESKILKPLFHAAGISTYQANTLFSGFMKMLYGAEQADKKAKDDGFVKLSNELFGTNKESIVTNAKKFLATHVPANVQPLLNELDEKQMTVLLAVTDGMAKKFTGEDPFRGAGSGAGGSGGETKDQLIAQMQAIQKDPVWSDPFKDKVKHAELTAKMEAIRGKLRKVLSPA